MKIVSVSHLFPNIAIPNSGVFVKERIKAVSELVDVRIVSPLPYFPCRKFFYKYKDFDKIPFKEIFDSLDVFHPKFFLIPKFFKFIDGYLYYWSTYFFFSKIIKNDVDLLDFHWVYPDAFAGLKFARKYNKKIIVTIRGNESICYFEHSLRKRLIVNTLRNVDHVIAVSNDMKNKVVGEYGVASEKVTVIPNGIQPDKFKIIDRSKARKTCGLEDNTKYILSLCRLSHEKGLEYLFEAFAGLHDQRIELLVVGDGPLKEKLLGMALDLGIDKRVKFIGAVSHEETMFWYNSADIYCLPSLWEGCPNVIIESLACGTPVVSTTVGGIPDLVPGQDYGFLIEEADARSLAIALDNAIEKRWDREKIAKYGANNTWDHVASKVVRVFASVLDEKLT